jgi:hypothetical protein
MIGRVLSGIIIVALVSIGVGGLIAPRNAAVQYGIAVDDPRALGFIRAMAVRDLVIGGLLGLMALAQERDLLGWGMGLTAVIAVVDLGVVTAAGRRMPRTPIARARALHATGAIGLLFAAAVLVMGY